MSAGRALSLWIFPWQLPYNWGKSTEKPQSGYNIHITKKHTHTHTCTHVRPHTYTYATTHSHTHTQMPTLHTHSPIPHTHTHSLIPHTHTCPHTHTLAHTTHTHTHTHTHAHTHTNPHTHTHINFQLHKMLGLFLTEQLLAFQKELRCVQLVMEPCNCMLLLKHGCAEVCLFVSVTCYGVLTHLYLALADLTQGKKKKRGNI